MTHVHSIATATECEDIVWVKFLDGHNRLITKATILSFAVFSKTGSLKCVGKGR